MTEEREPWKPTENDTVIEGMLTRGMFERDYVKFAEELMLEEIAEKLVGKDFLMGGASIGVIIEAKADGECIRFKAKLDKRRSQEALLGYFEKE